VVCFECAHGHGYHFKGQKDILRKGLPSATLDDIQELKVNFFQYFFTWFSLCDPFFPRAYLHIKGASFLVVSVTL
jgi:hypothetical protein